MNLFTTLFQTTVTPSAPNNADVITSTTENTIDSAPKKGSQSPYSSIMLLIVMFAIFYFLLIRPNQKKERKRKEEISALKEGDKVITSGGIKGTIVSIKEDTLTIDSKGTKLEILRIAIARVIR